MTAQILGHSERKRDVKLTFSLQYSLAQYSGHASNSLLRVRVPCIPKPLLLASSRMNNQKRQNEKSHHHHIWYIWIPLAASVIWPSTLLALLITWLAQGRPFYVSMSDGQTIGTS